MPALPWVAWHRAGQRKSATPVHYTIVKQSRLITKHAALREDKDMSADTRPWTVRQSRPTDAAGLQALFVEVFGYDRGVKHYEWKFDHNPAGPPIIAVAEADGVIVGQYALWPMKLRFGSEAVLGAQSLDTMTHPAYRGQGMFTRLANEGMRYAANCNIHVIFGCPNTQSYPGFVHKLGWRHIGDLPMYIRPLRPSRHHRIPPWAGPVVDLAAGLLPRGPRGGIEIRTTRPADAEMAPLLRCRDDASIRIEHDITYIDWRFDPASGMKYSWVSAYRDGSLAAVAIWGTDFRHGDAIVAELIGSDASSRSAALAEAIGQARAADCPLMRAMGRGSDVGRTLRRAGFLRRGKMPFIIRRLTTRTFDIDGFDSSQWTIFGADLDTM